MSDAPAPRARRALRANGAGPKGLAGRGCVQCVSSEHMFKRVTC